ncbi:protein zyg-11 homolog B-like isoform X1 [Pseudonaja textilis]|uniref:Zyg-11 family member A, cell cycle regulator n=2 Tax=Pseudonaja textilis TaxID=8673 RepID=A0A670Y1U4_PSETE|nr:protein zyg-11 homolog B-like isoform X1 [Pseudonaja textilis]
MVRFLQVRQRAPLPVCGNCPAVQAEASPYSLVDICLNVLVADLAKFCTEKPDGSLYFKESQRLPQEVADRLLQIMAYQELLNDGTVGIFQGNQIRLKQACIRKAKISAQSFKKAFCHHKLVQLDAAGMNETVTIADVVSGLGSNKWIQNNLQYLVLDSLTLFPTNSYERFFSQFHGLRSLSITNVLFGDEHLADVATLPRLESLNISNTSVTNISALLACRNRLKSLTMYSLKCLKMPTTKFLDVIRELKYLVHLDISDNQHSGSEIAFCLLRQKDILPNLVSLDISGNKSITDEAVEAFVRQRPRMHFIGLLGTAAGFTAFLSGQGSLKVSGGENEMQVLEALKRYNERPTFVKEAFFHLFLQTCFMKITKPEILKLVIVGMKNHPLDLAVQLTASACVLNLTRQGLAAGVPVRLLSSVIQLLLKAMETFPEQRQLQKNCLLSLSSVRILQDVPFNRFVAAKFVVQWLCNQENQHVQRIAVNVISILGLKLSDEQAAQLSAEFYIVVGKLLEIIEQKTNQTELDVTFHFTLRALWNLTDEAPTLCAHFMDHKGLDLFLRVLEIFSSDSSIQHKALGLLNNVAEVRELHPRLMQKDFVDHVSELLNSAEIEVSYFAAGIMANLISRGEEAWTLSQKLRRSLIEKLHSTLLKWPTPECKMVALPAYRSLKPFYPLLDCFTLPGVQIWAAWAILHVCCKTPAKYCAMLIEENGLQHLYNIKENDQSDPDVRYLITKILTYVETHVKYYGKSKHLKELQGHSDS